VAGRLAFQRGPQNVLTAERVDIDPADAGADAGLIFEQTVARQLANRLPDRSLAHLQGASETPHSQPIPGTQSAREDLFAEPVVGPPAQRFPRFGCGLHGSSRLITVRSVIEQREHDKRAKDLQARTRNAGRERPGRPVAPVVGVPIEVGMAPDGGVPAAEFSRIPLPI
jgi:hypothetical protein